ncbi:hypothetical protein Bca4012_072957 [Brassica carinata]
MIKWRCCPELVQFYGFISVEVLLDTPPGSPKNCLEAKGGSVRVKISLSRPVSFFMVKPRISPSRDQSSPLHSSRPLGFGQVLSDQPATSRLEHLTRRTVGCRAVTRRTVGRGRLKVPSFGLCGWWILKLCGIIGWPIMFLFDCWSTGSWFPLLEVRLWQEAKSNLVTVALGKDDWIAWCWTLGPPV